MVREWEYRWSRRTCLKVIEVILHASHAGVICGGVLVCAAIAIAYINEVEDYVDDHDGRLVIKDERPTPAFNDYDYERDYDYEHSGKFDAVGSKWAGGCALFVSCVGLIYHCHAIYVLTKCREFDIEKHNTIYSVTNTIICFLMGLSLLAGGIANLIYYFDNNALWSDTCSDYSFVTTPMICRYLQIVCYTEIACAVICFVSPLICILLCIAIISGGVLIRRKCQQNSTAAMQSLSLADQPPLCQPLLSTSQSPPCMPQTSSSTSPPLYTQINAPTNKLSLVSKPESPALPPYEPSAEPPHYEPTLTEPPSYEPTLTEPPFYEPEPPPYEPTLTEPPRYETIN